MRASKRGILLKSDYFATIALSGIKKLQIGTDMLLIYHNEH